MLTSEMLSKLAIVKSIPMRSAPPEIEIQIVKPLEID